MEGVLIEHDCILAVVERARYPQDGLTMMDDLPAWQRRALNLFGLSPVYLSTDTTPDRLVLHAAEGFILIREHAWQMTALGLRCDTRSLEGGYYELALYRIDASR